MAEEITTGLTDSIRKHALYRGQIVAEYLVGKDIPSALWTEDFVFRPRGGADKGASAALADSDSAPSGNGLPAGVVHSIATLGITKLSRAQKWFLERLLDQNRRKVHEATLLRGSPGAGKTTCGFIGCLLEVCHWAGTALWIVPDEDALATAKVAVEKAQLLAGPGGRIVFPYVLESASHRVEGVPSLVIATPDTIRGAVLKQTDAWRFFLQYLGLVFVDDLDSYVGLKGAHQAAIVRRLLAAAQGLGRDPLVAVASGAFANVTDFVEKMLGVSVDIKGKGIFDFDDELSERQKELIFWSAPLDLADQRQNELKPVKAFDDLVSLARMLLDCGRSVVFTSSDRYTLTDDEVTHIRQSVKDGQRIKGFCRPDHLPWAQSEETAVVWLGLQENLGWLRDRLRLVGGNALPVVIVSAHMPVFNAIAHVVRAKHTGLPSDLPEARLVADENASSMLRATPLPNAQMMAGHLLDALITTKAAKDSLAFSEMEDLLGPLGGVEAVGRVLAHDPRLTSLVRDRWDGKTVPVPKEPACKLRQNKEMTDLDPIADMPYEFPTEYYPGAIVRDGQRLAVVRRQDDGARSLQVMTSAQHDLASKRTERMFTVSFEAAYSGNAQGGRSGTSGGVPFWSGVRHIRERVLGYQELDLWSGDVITEPEKLATSDVVTEEWYGGVLILRLDRIKETQVEPAVINTIRLLLYSAMGGVAVAAHDCVECVLVDKNDNSCADMAQATGIALYSRVPGNGSFFDPFESRLSDLLRTCLGILVACPCSEGCANCLPVKQHRCWELPRDKWECVDKPHTTSVLGLILKNAEAESIANDRGALQQVSRIQRRVRDRIVPHLFATRLGLKMDQPVPLQPKNDIGMACVFTGKAVCLRAGLPESAYIGLLAREYGRQWQHEHGIPAAPLQYADPQNIEDERNVLFPVVWVTEQGWQAQAKLYTEGIAEWVGLRILDVPELQMQTQGGADNHGVVYSECCLHILWLERQYGVDAMVQMLSGSKDRTLYLAAHPNECALCDKTQVYASLSDTGAHVTGKGGLVCYRDKGEHPLLIRVSHYTAVQRHLMEAGGKLPVFKKMALDSGTKRSTTRPKTKAEYTTELLRAGLGTILDQYPEEIRDGLAALRLSCADCACCRNTELGAACSLLSVAYMHSSAERKAQDIADSLTGMICNCLSRHGQLEDGR